LQPIEQLSEIKKAAGGSPPAAFLTRTTFDVKTGDAGDSIRRKFHHRVLSQWLEDMYRQSRQYAGIFRVAPFIELAMRKA
jgi:hypothetical protein